MFSAKNELKVETIVARATEAAKETQGKAQAYAAPELHVVGPAGELVQGSFGYTGRDGSYYYS